jgi:hypothetical protein
MKTSVFVRPNLKAFLLGAVLLVIVQHLITTVHSQGQSATRPLAVTAREVTDKDLDEMVRRAREQPTAEVYTRISHYYEKRGDYKRALQYLRRAEKIGQADEGE